VSCREPFFNDRSTGSHLNAVSTAYDHSASLRQYLITCGVPSLVVAAPTTAAAAAPFKKDEPNGFMKVVNILNPVSWFG
jgi:hypothetical protein